MLSRFFALIICLIPNLAYAENVRQNDAYIKAQRQIQDLDRAYVPIEAGDKPSLVNANRLVNYAAILVVAGAATIKQAEQLEEARGKKLTPGEKLELAGKVAAQLTTGGESLAAFGAMRGASRLASPLLDAVGPKVGDAATSAALKSMVAHSLGTAVAMGATAPLAELWAKSVERLPEEDQQRAHNLVGALSEAADKPNALSAGLEIVKWDIVLQKTLKGMGEIAIVDPKARDMWLYDTWRNRIATGQFVSGAALISLGATAGGSVGSAVPVVGTTIGTIAGGGLGAVADTFLVSDAKKAEMTAAFANMRRGVLVNRLKSCMERLENTYRLSESASFNRDHKIGDAELIRPLDQCAKLREGIVTIDLDRAKNYFSQIVVAKHRSATAHACGRTDEETKWKTALLKALFNLDHLRADIGEFYDAQKNRLDHFLAKIKNPPSVDLLQQESSRCQKMHDLIKVTLSNVADDEPSAIRMFEAANEGFSEKAWLGYEDTPPPLATPLNPGTPPAASPFGASPPSSQQ